MSLYKYLVEISTTIKSDKDLLNYMKSNIRYGNYIISKWKLHDWEYVDDESEGNCHDQVMFELHFLSKLGYSPFADFCIELKKDSNKGGRTHSYVYYKKDNKYYWFENAWRSQVGIHGPYNTHKDIRNDIEEKMLKESDYDYLEFGHFNGKPGMTLQELLDACLSESIDESYIDESKDQSTLDKNFKKKNGLHFNYLDIHKEGLKYIPKEWQQEFNFKAKEGYIAVCKEDNKLAGFIYWSLKSGIISPLLVYKNYRGYGISEVLMKHAISGGGYKLGVYCDNEIAIRLYKKLGFKEIEHKHYADGTEYMIMELEKH